MITTIVGVPERGGNSNFYVTAEDPRGPWSDPVWLDKDGFDPSLLFADGEAYYLRDGKGADPGSPARLPGADRSGDRRAARADADDLAGDGRHLARGMRTSTR